MSLPNLLETPAQAHWKRIGVQHHHGINTPLFSIHSQNSCGIGEFEDLKLLIDLLKPAGFDVIQLLPLYASGDDPSPYNAISANALNEIYISLHALPGIDQSSDLLASIQNLKPFNQTLRISYKEVSKRKEAILKTYIERERTNLQKMPEYALFIRDNPWIETFAQFKTYKEINQGSFWKEWTPLPLPKELIDYYTCSQFIAYSQMQGVKAYAETHQMFLMGDIPILISPDSADVWNQPQLFDLNFAAGAPPDMYEPSGQYWGFPIYNMAEMENQNFRFWKERLSSASHLYHIYRIDHVIGFFRIFSIPIGQLPSAGQFSPPDENLWQSQGQKTLQVMLDSTFMLPIAEDLGIDPQIARDTMRQMGIPGTKVMRWERYWEGDLNYKPLNAYPLDSLTCVSTHDSEPLTLWWNEQRDDVKLFAKNKGWELEPNLNQKQIQEILRDSHHTGSLFHINLLQEYLSMYPELTWGNQISDRINVPGTISDDNWTYRYKPSLEALAAHPQLITNLKELIS